MTFEELRIYVNEMHKKIVEQGLDADKIFVMCGNEELYRIIIKHEMQLDQHEKFDTVRCYLGTRARSASRGRTDHQPI